jgi:hypothetical protein
MSGLKSLPAVGYLEQSVADAVAQALVKVTPSALGRHVASQRQHQD